MEFWEEINNIIKETEMQDGGGGDKKNKSKPNAPPENPWKPFDDAYQALGAATTTKDSMAVLRKAFNTNDKTILNKLYVNYNPAADFNKVKVNLKKLSGKKTGGKYYPTSKTITLDPKKHDYAFDLLTSLGHELNHYMTLDEKGQPLNIDLNSAEVTNSFLRNNLKPEFYNKLLLLAANAGFEDINDYLEKYGYKYNNKQFRYLTDPKEVLAYNVAFDLNDRNLTDEQKKLIESNKNRYLAIFKRDVEPTINTNYIGGIYDTVPNQNMIKAKTKYLLESMPKETFYEIKKNFGDDIKDEELQKIIELNMPEVAKGYMYSPDLTLPYKGLDVLIGHKYNKDLNKLLNDNELKKELNEELSFDLKPELTDEMWDRIFKRLYWEGNALHPEYNYDYINSYIKNKILKFVKPKISYDNPEYLRQYFDEKDLPILENKLYNYIFKKRKEYEENNEEEEEDNEE